MQASAHRVQESEAESGQGQMARAVETVDRYSSAGHGVAQKPTQIVHQEHTWSETSGGVLANAAASIATTLESAKQALSRK